MSTFHSIHFHIIFATKHRHPWIRKELQPRLHEYMAGVAKGLDAVPLKVGGIDDHVHMLLGCKTTHRPSDLVREIKKSASAWVRDQLRAKKFAWQEGYAIISVSPNACSDVASYIENQAEHHRRRTFGEEFEDILQRAGIPYEPRYLE